MLELFDIQLYQFAVFVRTCQAVQAVAGANAAITTSQLPINELPLTVLSETLQLCQPTLVTQVLLIVVQLILIQVQPLYVVFVAEIVFQFICILAQAVNAFCLAFQVFFSC